MTPEWLPSTIVITSGLAVLGFFTRRWIHDLDERLRCLSEELRNLKTEKLDKDDHDRYCYAISTEITDLWSRVNHHSHTERGNVVVEK